MKSLLIIGSIWLALVVGCTSGRPRNADSETRKTPPAIEGDCVIPILPTSVEASWGNDPSHADGKLITFAPPFKATDGNLYNASLHSLWCIWGKDRGLFQLSDARLQPDRLGGNASCWPIHNPEQKYCVLPIKDANGKQITSMYVWIE